MKKVTVAPKTSRNDKDGKGASVCYYIGDKEAPLIKLERMNENNKFATYAFEIDCEGYPFVLESRTGNETKQLTAPIEKGKLKFKVDNSFPNFFYYACSNHSDMGGPIKIESKDDVKIRKVEIGKPLKNAVRIRQYKDSIMIGLSGGQIYKYKNDNVVIFRDINSIVKKHNFSLIDFVVLADDRIFALASGIEKEKDVINLIEVKVDNAVSSHIPFKGQFQDSPICLQLSGDVIYIVGRKNIYRIVSTKPDEYDLPEDNQKDAEDEPTEIYMKAPIEAKAAFVRKGFLYLASNELWKEDRKLFTFESAIQSIILGSNEKEFLTASKDGIISQYTLENEKCNLEKQCRIEEGIISIVKLNDVYVLANDAENRSSLYTIVQW